jgi:hypothetical protein
MGCDIHVVLEVKTTIGWVAVDTYQGHHKSWVTEGEYDWSSPITTARNYGRFGALAGVRRDGPDPKGIPDDASGTTKHLVDRWGVDGHSHSWLPSKEAAEIYLQTAGPDLEDYKREYPENYFFGIERHDKNEEYRVVFWFDN